MLLGKTHLRIINQSLGINFSLIVSSFLIHFLYFPKSNFKQKTQTSASNLHFKLQLQTSTVNIKFKLQPQTSTPNFKLQPQTSTSKFNFDFKLQLQTSTSNFKLKLQLQTSTSNFHFKSQAYGTSVRQEGRTLFCPNTDDENTRKGKIYRKIAQISS